MVVLSACDTSLGTSATAEGLISLQRAFSQAGAVSVVASQWKVDDDATKTLMIEFYTNLWSRRLSTLEALRQAQLSMLRHYNPIQKALNRGALISSDPLTTSFGLAPYYWAAFTLSGDWR